MSQHQLRRIACSALLLSLGISVLLVRGLIADDNASKPAENVSSGQTQAEDKTPRVSLEVARDRAKLLHEVYSATLHSMHRRYFHGDRAVVPARALEDVFTDLKHERQIEAKWISASLSAMSLDNEPQTDFERAAARQLADGKDGIEVIESGYYRHAGSIPLTGGCLRCHGGFFLKPSDTPKFAGLVISVPVKPGEKLESSVTAPAP